MYFKKAQRGIRMDITDIKDINLVDYMYYIHFDEITKPTREMQRQLNPSMKEVVRAKDLKLIDANIIYCIF